MASLEEQIARLTSENSQLKAKLTMQNKSVNGVQSVSVIDRLSQELVNAQVELAVVHRRMTVSQREDLTAQIWERVGPMLYDGGCLLDNEIADHVANILIDNPHLVEADKRRNLLETQRADEFCIPEELVENDKLLKERLREASKSSNKRFMVVSKNDPTYLADDYREKFDTAQHRLAAANRAAQEKAANKEAAA